MCYLNEVYRGGWQASTAHDTRMMEREEVCASQMKEIKERLRVMGVPFPCKHRYYLTDHKDHCGCDECLPPGCSCDYCEGKRNC